MLKKIINTIKNWFTIERYDAVFHHKGDWKITHANTGLVTDECSIYTILQSNKGNYKLEYSGYKPKQHSTYENLFKLYRGVVEGTHYIQGGEIFSYEKSLDELSLEECQVKLQEAIDNEDYELAEKIKNIMQKFA